MTIVLGSLLFAGTVMGTRTSERQAVSVRNRQRNWLSVPNHAQEEIASRRPARSLIARRGLQGAEPTAAPIEAARGGVGVREPPSGAGSSGR